MGANNKKLNIEFIRAEFAKEDYTLLTKIYKNNRQKLYYIRPRGHKHSITWNSWQRGSRCPCFSNTMKPNIELIRVEFAKEGYILLTKVYKGNTQKLYYICPRKHRHFISWHGWTSKRKPRCPYCADNAKLNIEFICAEFAKEDYTLLTKVYKNSKQKLDYICPKGHRHSITWNGWQQKQRCPCFSNQMKPTIESIRADFVKEGYRLLTKVYRNGRQKLKYICSRGHRHSVSWENWNSKAKQRCPFCSNRISRWEKAVKSFLGASNIDYVPNDRTQLINPETGRNFELDIWFPKLNKAIECNGLYWHSKDDRKECDKTKQQLCKEQGIDLLVITDKEWNDDVDKCKNKIQEFLC